ncbi:hypothetical protein BJ508DRAFT_411145 [Ascobolus immersus RN42]|uniref:Mg-dependent DNase n=1 Tax=Ascobolus immersus RN42 TaxID=1160509 RepID=A0A3N4IL96_ASCIM|nr:hypothetical protein BJ508DRAFT_411145 [Ascobolus immersus RN42]
MASPTVSPTLEAGQTTPPTEAAATPTPTSYKPRYIDVALNLADPVFRGIYHSQQRHDDDLGGVLKRAGAVGCSKILVTGSDLHNSKTCVDLCKEIADNSEAWGGVKAWSTVGIHPCHAKEVDEEGFWDTFKTRVEEGMKSGYVKAFGEFGLDYDRLEWADAETQRRAFTAQLEYFRTLTPALPLFLHSRAAHKDFLELLKPHLSHFPGALVHSFTGTLEEVQELVELGCYVGINGCSLKTDENLEIVRALPLDRIMLETDGPWCEMRKSSAACKLMDKKGVELPDLGPLCKKKEKWVEGQRINGRNEPVAIQWVALAVATIKEVSLEEVCEAAWKNSIQVFGLGEYQQ